MGKGKRLDEIAKREKDNYLKSRSMIHLESAIGSLLSLMSVRDVVKVLRDQADHLEQFE